MLNTKVKTHPGFINLNFRISNSEMITRMNIIPWKKRDRWMGFTDLTFVKIYTITKLIPITSYTIQGGVKKKIRGRGGGCV